MFMLPRKHETKKLDEQERKLNASLVELQLLSAKAAAITEELVAKANGAFYKLKVSAAKPSDVAAGASPVEGEAGEGKMG